MSWNTFSFQFELDWRMMCPPFACPTAGVDCAFWSMFLKIWCVLLFPTRLADPRAWRAHLGMRIQGRAKFVSAVRRIIVHEYYNSRNYDYDIALLQLSKPWPDTMSHVIQPICVPPFSHKVRSGEKCWITGWGQKQEVGEFNILSCRLVCRIPASASEACTKL